MRLGGLFNITWDYHSYGVDGKGNKCTPESAGFGLVDNAFAPYGIRSFGILTAHNKPGKGLTADNG